MQPIRRPVNPALRYGAILLILAPLIAFAPMRVALGLAGLVAVAALAWIGPVWGVYAAILSVPVQQIVTLPGGTSFTQAAVLLMAGAWLVRAVGRPQQMIITGPLFWAWLALLGTLLLATSFTPYSTSESIKATLRWGVAFLIWFVAVNSVTTRRTLIGLIACLLVAPFANALIGLYQFASGSGPPSFRIAESLPFVRAYGTIGQPNSFAGYMNMAWPLGIGLAMGWTLNAKQAPHLAGTSSVRRFVPMVSLWLLAFALCAALAVSFSLGGWVGALVGCVGLLAALGRRWAIAAGGGTGALLAFLLLGGATLFPDAIGARVTRLTGMLRFFDPATVTVTPENFALVERMAQMKAGWLMLLAHPLVGVGPGAYTGAYSDVASAPWYASRGHAHNFYLHMAAETGLFGLIAYLALIGTTVVLAVIGLQRVRGPLARGVMIGCCGVIAAVAGHNLFENLHVLNLGVQLSGIWAVIVLLPRVAQSRGLGAQSPRKTPSYFMEGL